MTPIQMTPIQMTPIQMTPIQVVGIGLEGSRSLTPEILALVQQADVLVGSGRHLGYFPDFPGETWEIGDLQAILTRLRSQLQQPKPGRIVVLASGDPLFFGLGRLLLAELSPEHLTFHPHLSSLQLAFSRVKLPWNEATLVSVHGRSPEALMAALRRGDHLIGILTDGLHTPAAIARLVSQLELPTPYTLWVCENLGGADERVRAFSPSQALEHAFSPLTVVILHRPMAWDGATTDGPTDHPDLPLLGVSDTAFASFADRPGLMTKREIRVLALGELALLPGQVVWDIGAGTGSVSIEVARLVPQGKVYAIEKTAIGISLIRQNCQRFQVENIVPIQGTAPGAVADLPLPDRIFIGGSGGHLSEILETCSDRLAPQGKMVLALATLEHFQQVLAWIHQQNTAPSSGMARTWEARYLQVNLCRSTEIATLTRWQPLNPVTLITLASRRG